MNKNVVRIYDLDGTLSNLNSTFHFIFSYYKKNNLVKYFFYKIVGKIINKIPFVEYYKIRKAYIGLVFNGINKGDLEAFFEKEYKSMFLDNLTALGKKIIANKEENITSILLTGCIDIPAMKIGKIFNFGDVICTELDYMDGKVVGMKKDTYGNFKLNFLDKKENDYYIYYTDEESEYKLKEIMDEFILIK